MITNSLKQKLNSGIPTLGPFIGQPSPQIVELIGWIGYDFVIIDCEHGPMDYETAESMIRAAEGAGTTPVVRVGLNEPQHLQRYLDAGAQGIMVPLINTAEQAKRVVDAVKYPPIGKRGAYPGRGARYGLQDFAEYIHQANEQTAVILQIETPESIKNYEEIINTENADIIFFGPGDLSVNFGKPGQPQHPEVVSVIKQLVKSTLSAGKHCGTMAVSPESVKFWHDVGVNWLVTGVSSFIVSAGRAHLAESKQAIGM